jgi:hypothetical protein
LPQFVKGAAGNFSKKYSCAKIGLERCNTQARVSETARALIFGKFDTIYPALFVIRFKSLNRSKTIKGANLRLWPTRLHWTSKAARRAPHVVKHVQRIMPRTATAGFSFNTE